MGNFNPQLPTKATGTDKYITFFVTRDRSPTGSDYRQPETGNLYSVGTVWQVGKDPTTGTQGDLWMLSKIVANVGYWVQISSGVVPSGGVLTLSDTANTLVFPTAGGNIQLEGTAGQITITSDPGNNKLVFALTGGSGAVDSFAVQAATAPGVTPVFPTGLGLVTVNGAIVANHSVPLETRSRALNTYNVEAQYATTAAATDGTKSGMAHFDSARFTADSSGFVSLNGSGVGLTITGDTGGPLNPSSGNWNIVGAGGVTISGAGNTLTVNGTGAGFSSVVIQTFTSSGTYTPTSGMSYCIVEMVGGGGGGAGAATTGASQVSGGGGGGAGEYARGTFSAATIGASKSVTIGAAGGITIGADGSAGGNTSLGSLMTALGGDGGHSEGPSGDTGGPGGLGGTGGTGGQIRFPGQPGGKAQGSYSSNAFSYGGNGGGSYFGAGGRSRGYSVAAEPGLGYGAGGGGVGIKDNTSQLIGAVGTAGIVVITEYIL